LEDDYSVSREILRKQLLLTKIRKIILWFLMLSTGKKYDELLWDFYDIFERLSK